jgi:hypothetical protein
MSLVEMQEPVWDAQKGESADAYTKFRTFRDLPSKQTKNVLIKLGIPVTQKSLQNINRLSSDWRWNERTVKYQEYLAKKEEEAVIEEIKEMNKRHRTISKGALTIIAKIEKEFLIQLDSGEMQKKMSLKDWADIISKISGKIDPLSKVERAALGQPTEIVKQDFDGKMDIKSDYENMSDKELHDLAAKYGFEYRGVRSSSESSE